MNEENQSLGVRQRLMMGLSKKLSMEGILPILPLRIFVSLYFKYIGIHLKNLKKNDDSL